jgi:hypothetical protein
MTATNTFSLHQPKWVERFAHSIEDFSDAFNNESVTLLNGLVVSRYHIGIFSQLVTSLRDAKQFRLLQPVGFPFQ